MARIILARILALCLVASAAALPVQPHSETPVSGSRCGSNYGSEGSCMSDPCCNWCKHAESPFAGFCTDSNPWIPTRLECKRDPAEAEKAQAECHVTAKKIAAEAPVAANTTKPDSKFFASMCGKDSQEECDSMPCCQWCSVSSYPSAAFCMPQIEKGDNLQCSKTTTSCSDAKDQDACTANEDCAWQAFFEGGGQCYFDWSKCNSPTPGQV